MWYLLTGSLPSMASSQSFLLASEKACNVMIPCLWTINILHKSICKTHTYIWTVMWFPCASDSREVRQAVFRRPQKADLGVRFPNCDVIWSQRHAFFFLKQVFILILQILLQVMLLFASVLHSVFMKVSCN